jgi:ABC-type dipeptide/oligopeptide/nickel transport system permease component
MIPVFIGITIILFIMRSPAIVPGDPVRMIVGERAISPVLYEQVVKENALDKPLYAQYGRYLTHLAQGDLGQSYQKKRPVTAILFEKFPNTLKLSLVALIIESIIGLAAGILSAVKKYSFWDMLVTLSTSILVAVPVLAGHVVPTRAGCEVQAVGITFAAGIGHVVARVSIVGALHLAWTDAGLSFYGVCGQDHAEPVA